MNLNATLIIEVLSFLILLGLLVKFLYRPVLGILDKRADEIRQKNRQIQESLSRAEDQRLKAEEILAESKNEALQIRERISLDAEKLRHKIINQAKEEADKVLSSCREEILRETQKLKEKIKDEAVDLSIKAAEQILRREFSPKDQRRLIEELTEDIK